MFTGVSCLQVCEVGVLLGLMCKYSCEEGRMIVYGAKDHRQVDLEKGTVLDNMSSVLKLQEVSQHSCVSSFSSLVFIHSSVFIGLYSSWSSFAGLYSLLFIHCSLFTALAYIRCCVHISVALLCT